MLDILEARTGRRMNNETNPCMVNGCSDHAETSADEEGFECCKHMLEVPTQQHAVDTEQDEKEDYGGSTLGAPTEPASCAIAAPTCKNNTSRKKRLKGFLKSIGTCAFRPIRSHTPRTCTNISDQYEDNDKAIATTLHIARTASKGFDEEGNSPDLEAELSSSTVSIDKKETLEQEDETNDYEEETDDETKSDEGTYEDDKTPQLANYEQVPFVLDSPWLAAKRGDLMALQRFESIGQVDWMEKDKRGCPPLYYACRSGAANDMEAVRFLLQIWPTLDIPADVAERCKKNALDMTVVRLLESADNPDMDVRQIELDEISVDDMWTEIPEKRIQSLCSDEFLGISELGDVIYVDNENM